ncbi:MAG: (d)CMP kinase, partial [Acidimicrobiia bacterium]
ALGLPVLETGAMYRALTWAVLREGLDPAAAAEVGALAGKLRIEAAARVTVDGTDVTAAIREPAVTAAVSVVSTHPEVRAVLVAAQRAWIDAHGGGVVEGRDIGTVVAPDAALKVYLSASAEERAARRVRQGEPDTLEDLRRRDTFDSTRPVAPLAVAPDAVTVDTTGLTPDEVVARILSYLPATAAAPPGPARGEWLRYLAARAVVVGLCRLLWRPRILHRERLPRRGPYVLAPSHRSLLDTPFVACLTRRRIRFMGKAELWKHPWAGRLISALGAFPVERDVADRASLRAALDALEGGEPLVVFPEGTRRSGPLVEDLHDGVAYISLRAGVPVVPVGIGGSERILARGRKLPRLSRVTLVVGEPLVPPRRDGPVRRRDVAELTEQVRAAVQLLFDTAQASSPSS